MMVEATNVLRLDSTLKQQRDTVAVNKVSPRWTSKIKAIPRAT